VITVLTTIIIALAVNPTYRLVSRAVKRMLYGARGDPCTALSVLGRRLAASTDPRQVLDALAQAAAEKEHPMLDTAISAPAATGRLTRLAIPAAVAAGVLNAAPAAVRLLAPAQPADGHHFVRASDFIIEILFAASLPTTAGAVLLLARYHRRLCIGFAAGLPAVIALGHSGTLVLTVLWVAVAAALARKPAGTS
jgi:hypothetical protein